MPSVCLPIATRSGRSVNVRAVLWSFSDLPQFYPRTDGMRGYCCYCCYCRYGSNNMTADPWCSYYLVLYRCSCCSYLPLSEKGVSCPQFSDWSILKAALRETCLGLALDGLVHDGYGRTSVSRRLRFERLARLGQPCVPLVRANTQYVSFFRWLG